ncbi:E3 ubiquitin-protein ligase ZSWIM2, partial [Clonorchis sinensis]
VHIGEEHTCTCTVFKTTGELCLHIVWIFLKRFKIDENDPICWQLGLCEREIIDVLDGKHSRRNANLVQNKFEDSQDLENQRRIGPDDLCPICQDELLSKQRFPVTFCRKGCGNSVHIRCMRVWTDHQRKQNTISLSEAVPCPICRGEFASLGILLRELSEDVKAMTSKNVPTKTVQSAIPLQPQNLVMKPRHPATKCLSCQCSPILGNIYRCETCFDDMKEEMDTYLCSACFRSNQHADHKSFAYRETPQKKWTQVPKNRGTPHNLHHTLEPKFAFKENKRGKINWHQFFGESDTLPSTSLSVLPQWTVRLPRMTGGKCEDVRKPAADRANSFGTLHGEAQFTSGSNNVRGFLSRTEQWGPLKISGLLAPGRQCRICLMAYQVGDVVRRLSPGCQHIFHATCIDPWLLHRSASCPLDGTPVTPLPLDSKQNTLQTGLTPNSRSSGLSGFGDISICASACAIQSMKPSTKAQLTASAQNGVSQQLNNELQVQQEEGLSIVGHTVTSGSLETTWRSHKAISGAMGELPKRSLASFDRGTYKSDRKYNS